MAVFDCGVVLSHNLAAAVSLIAKSVLWELSPPSGAEFVREPSYLLGTMHARFEVAWIRMPEVMALLHRCSAYVAEYDLRTFDAAAYRQATVLPPEQHLHTLMPASDWVRLQRYCSRWLGWTLSEKTPQPTPLVLYHELVNAMVATSSYVAATAPCTPEEALLAAAMERGKDIGGLETFEAQITLLQQVPLRHQVYMLRKLLHRLPNGYRQVKQLHRYYREQDLVGLYRASCRQSGVLRHALLRARNPVMAQAMIRQAACSPTLFAIGAAHLAGQQGVLRLLKLAGWRLRAV